MENCQVDPIKRPAWEQAQQAGFDMDLIEQNIRRSPAQRIRRHGHALRMATQLREATRRNAGT
jgi:hypothetical protein